MSLEFYDGRGPRRQVTPGIMINKAGQVYINAGLMPSVPPGLDYWRIAYDAARRLLVLVPVEARMAGASRAVPQNGRKATSAVRISCLNALRSWGLVPRDSWKLAATWSAAENRVEVILPAEKTGSSEDRKSSPIEAKRTRNAEKAEALDAALAHEDALPEMADKKRYMTSLDICDRYHFSQGRLHQLKREGFPLATQKEGRWSLYLRSEVEAWMAQRRGKRLSQPAIKPEAAASAPPPIKAPPEGTGITAVAPRQCGTCCWHRLGQCIRGAHAGTNTRDDFLCPIYVRKRMGPPAAAPAPEEVRRRKRDS
jgi:hypothetical protein